MEAVKMDAVKIEQWANIKELVSMSIGTDKGLWWADPTFGSELWKLKQSGKVNSKTAGTVEQIILESLAWLIADRLVSNITCRAEQTGKNQIAYTVTVLRPDGGQPIIIKDVWNAV